MKSFSTQVFAGFLLLSASSFAYQVNQSTEKMIREGLAQSFRPALAKCTLPEEVAMIINGPYAFISQVDNCLAGLPQAKEFRDLPQACNTLPGLENIAEIAPLAGIKFETIKTGLLQGLPPSKAQVAKIQAASPDQDPVLLGSVGCRNTNGAAEYFNFSGKIRETSSGTELKVSILQKVTK